MANVNDIRTSFLDYFAKNGHERVASSPLVPRNDPTLMFANSGMVQFKDYFTGKAKPGFPRATTAQKCVRASVNSILQRTRHDKNRPLLQTADPRQKLEQLAREREPYYMEVAHLIIETGRPNVQSLVQSILNQLDMASAAPAPAPGPAEP